MAPFSPLEFATSAAALHCCLATVARQALPHACSVSGGGVAGEVSEWYLPLGIFAKGGIASLLIVYLMEGVVPGVSPGGAHAERLLWPMWGEPALLQQEL